VTFTHFIDSSAFFALGDKASSEGQEINSFLLEKKPSLVTSHFVFAETISLITKRVGKKKGLETGLFILESGIVHLEEISSEIFREAWALYKKYSDKDFDLIDASSFIFCRKQKIEKVITLDRHFKQMGFKTIP